MACSVRPLRHPQRPIAEKAVQAAGNAAEEERATASQNGRPADRIQLDLRLTGRGTIRDFQRRRVGCT
jgi:hypothetical protein